MFFIDMASILEVVLNRPIAVPNYVLVMEIGVVMPHCHFNSMYLCFNIYVY